jgi:hypothetical protein
VIHHLSISARDPKQVAEVLAEFMGGGAMPFPPAPPGSWIAFSRDQHGTQVEVYPAGTELREAGSSGVGFGSGGTTEPGYGPTHFALSVETSPDQIAAIAKREGWECHLCDRGGAFHVMEVWVENVFMVELLPPAFAAEYLALWRRLAPQPA